VYAWESGPALVQTVDFFTPIVDDPYVYGQIAAANAVSDIYAMGGRPLTALAIAAFPKDDFEPDAIRAIFQGGFDKLREAGVALLGGHTVQDREIKFGYAVSGSIDPARVLSNAGAKPGDVLFLTKPLGTGIVGTAIKFDRIGPQLMEQAVQSMRTLNRDAAEALQAMPAGAVHSCTDITGFGLAGHGSEMARASHVTLVFEAGRLPVFDGVLEIARLNRSGGLGSNEEHFARGVQWDRGGDRHRSDSAPTRLRHGSEPDYDALKLVLYDPQTSGGLLVAVSPEAADIAEAAMGAAGVDARRIGTVQAAVPNINIRVI